MENEGPTAVSKSNKIYFTIKVLCSDKYCETTGLVKKPTSVCSAFEFRPYVESLPSAIGRRHRRSPLPLSLSLSVSPVQAHLSVCFFTRAIDIAAAVWGMADMRHPPFPREVATSCP